VNYVSFWDAARFTNWLTTGNTETGVYVLTANGITNNTITRDATAWANGGVAIASENEWYKAAYYDPTLNGGAGGYWLYPTQSNSITTADANYNGTSVTNVGTYAGDPSYYGTFDQGGNVGELSDEILSTSNRGLRGGSFYDFANNLQSSSRNSFGSNPTFESNYIGFRVSSLAAIPEPSTYAAIVGSLGLLMALMRRRGRRTL
jgi:formylglycine-generating enzyme